MEDHRPNGVGRFEYRTHEGVRCGAQVTHRKEEEEAGTVERCTRFEGHERGEGAVAKPRCETLPQSVTREGQSSEALAW